jgi:hypothetical protein
MVDLMELYKRRGFDAATRELPDYIPLFLEYLAQRPPQEAGELLADAGHILALLQARLMKRESLYQAVFAALTRLAGAEDKLAALHAAAAAEPRDDTPEALDREWERTEEEVTFGEADAVRGACGQGAAIGGEVPVRWQQAPPRPQPAQLRQWGAIETVGAAFGYADFQSARGPQGPRKRTGTALGSRMRVKKARAG